MRIDAKTDKSARVMLGHAIQGELAELEAVIDSAGDEIYATIIGLCMLAAGYIAIDVSGRWPSDAAVQEIARRTSTDSTDYQLRQQDVHDYLSRGALGFKQIQEVFTETVQDYTLPVLITAQLLVRFCPKDNDLWGYLDRIWNAVEAADRADLSLLPALMLRSQRTKTAAKNY